MSVATDPINEVLDRLDEVSSNGDGWTARCPAHDDRTPSLSVAKGNSQPVVFNCHAGCSSEEIVNALGLQWADICEGGITESEFEQAPWKHGEQVDTYPYHDADGNHVYTVKRYEHPERGWKSFRPYLPDNKRAGLGRQDRVLYRLPKVQEHASDGRIVFVVEGEKDVHTLEERGFTATTTGSTDTWKDRFASDLSGAKVVIIPDNDKPGRKYARDVAKSCFPVAEWVRIVELDDVPSSGDVTDWFARGHEPEELSDLIKEAGNFDPSDLAPRGDGQQSEEPELDGLSGWDRIKALYEQGEKGEARLQAAQQAIDDRAFATRRQTERLYVYDPDSFVYEDGGDQALSELLVRQLGTQHSRHEQKEIGAKVRALTFRDSFGGPVVPVANGDLDVESGTLRDPTPEHAPLARSPAAWREDAACPIFRNYLSEAVPDERERATLQEYIGYSLLHWRLPFHKALFLVGPTASGKSTLLDLVRKVLGKTSSLTPQQLVNGRFGPSELDGAWANIRADISAALLKDVGLFKEIVAGDPIYVERKYEQGYTLHPKAKHLYSANRLPSVQIDDDAFYRRILLVSFPRTVPRQDRDPELGDRLEQEMDGVLRWAVEGLTRVMDNEGFTHDRTPEETRHRWEARSSSIGRFKALNLNVSGSGDDFEPKQKVYSAYTAFCEEEGLSAESQRKFTRTLKGDPKITDGDRTPSGQSSQTSCYVGVQFRESDEAPF